MIFSINKVKYAHVNHKVQNTVLFVLSISGDVIPSVKSKSKIGISKRNYESARVII